MLIKCLFTLLLLILLEISDGYEVPRNYDNVRSYPVLKSSYYSPSQQQKLLKVKSGSQKFKREHVDNVKGELVPSSREDILKIKKLKFHGRSSPNAKPEITEAPVIITTTHKPRTTTTSSSDDDYYFETIPIEPSERNDYEFYNPSRSFKSPKSYKTDVSSSNDNKVIKAHYVPHDSPFYPLMRPSPINVMPTEPPSFDTVRNYVRYLKMRQDKFFDEFDDEVKPVPAVVVAKQQQHEVSVPYDGEIDYFKEREKELAKEEELRNQFSPIDFGSNDRIDEAYVDDDARPYREDYESETVDKSNHNNNAELQDYYDDNKANDNEDYAVEEESRKKENFVPFRLYAQVRHMEADHHEQAPKNGKKRPKEKISLAKKNIYYKEEGYEDKMYDHGGEKVNYDYGEKSKENLPKNGHQKQRSKRSTDNDNLDVSQLPIALAYIKKSELPNLTGEKLLRHLDDLLRNSSIYLPDDDDDIGRPIKITKPKKTQQKYPYYDFPDDVLSEMSAHRYSENLKNYPKHKESLYDHKNIRQCDEIEDEVDPVPEDIEEKGKSSRYNKKPQRLHGLGDKIECLRAKYFGKDPFDNPLFHEEEEYIAATIPIPVNHNLSRQANPLITVYDDVINNIRTGILDEFKKKREAQDALKAASEQIAIRAEQTNIPNFNAVASVANNFPIFDINNFIPKFMGAKISYDLLDDDDDDDDNNGSAVNELQKINKKQRETQNYQTTTEVVVEKPKVKRNNKANLDVRDILPPLPPQKAIKNFQPSKIIKNNQQKYRRIVPNTLAYPTKQIHSFYLPPPPPSLTQPSKTTYRFKLL